MNRLTPHTGPLELVVLDWAGTTIDHGCMAPVRVFQEAFRTLGVEVTAEEVRKPMGMEKRAHIATMAQMPEVAARWQQVHGTAPTEDDIDRMYAAFVPLQEQVVSEFTTPITGVPATIEALRGRGLKIGSSTGYPQAVMNVVEPAARDLGYAPDAVFCGDSTAVGRPAPFLIFENMKALDVHHTGAVVKVDDTVAGIVAGRNAGVWTIGVAATGNLVGLPEDELAALAPDHREARIERARNVLADAGAHLVIDHLRELPDALQRIEASRG